MLDSLILLGSILVLLSILAIIILWCRYLWVVFTTSDWFLGLNSIKRRERKDG